jgi:hypothetical protein
LINDCFRLRIQPIDATHWAKRSAGVSKLSVSLGRSFPDPQHSLDTLVRRRCDLARGLLCKADGQVCEQSHELTAQVVRPLGADGVYASYAREEDETRLAFA